MDEQNQQIEPYITLSQATKYCSYSQEYLSLRARQGKLKAEKIDGIWFTKKSYLKEYEEKNSEMNFQIQYEDVSLNRKPNLPDILLAEIHFFNKEKFKKTFYHIVNIFRNFLLSVFTFFKFDKSKKYSNLKSSKFRSPKPHSPNQLIGLANFLAISFLLILTMRFFIPSALGTYGENQNKVERILSLSSEKFSNAYKYQFSNIKNKLTNFGKFLRNSQLNNFNLLKRYKNNYKELAHSVVDRISYFNPRAFLNKKDNYYTENNPSHRVLGASEVSVNISSKLTFLQKIINSLVSLNKYRDYSENISKKFANKVLSINLVLRDSVVRFIRDAAETQEIKNIYLGATDKVQPQIIQNYHTANGDTQVIQKTILVKGEKGDKGDAGPKGDTGEKGDKGDKGEDGSFTGGVYNFIGGGTTIVQNGGGVSLSDNNTWTGINTFDGPVNLSSDLYSSASLIVTGSSSFATTTAMGLVVTNNGLNIASSTPAVTVDTLYNLGGDLYWNGSPLGSLITELDPVWTAASTSYALLSGANFTGDISIGGKVTITALTGIADFGSEIIANGLYGPVALVSGAITDEIGLINKGDDTYIAVYDTSENAYYYGGTVLKILQSGASSFIGDLSVGGRATITASTGIVDAAGFSINGSPIVSSQWITNGSDIYYNSGNVGIGTTDPLSGLHVSSTDMIASFESGDYSKGGFYIGNGGMFSNDEFGIYDLAGDAPMVVYEAVDISGYNDIMHYNNIAVNVGSGNVGIGTTTPQYALTVVDSNVNTIASFVVDGYGGEMNIVISDEHLAAGYTAPMGSYGVGGGTAFVKYGASDGDWGRILYANSDDTITLNGATTLTNNLSVGGRATITASTGIVDAAGFSINGSPIVSSRWTPNAYGNGIYYNSGRVGIGTNDPQATLDVTGNVYFYDSTKTRSISFFPSSGNQEIRASGQLNIVPSLGGVLLRSGSNTSLTMRNSSNDSTILLHSRGASYFNGGNVGIGITAPSSALHVVNSTSPQLTLGYNSATSTTFRTDSSGDLTINTTGGHIVFANNNVFNIGGVSALPYNAISNSGVSTLELDDNDLYVEGTLDVKGHSYFGSALRVNGLIYTPSSFFATQPSSEIWLGHSRADLANFRAFATGNVYIDEDNAALYLGEDQDANILWNGTDLVINTGAGTLNVTGTSTMRDIVPESNLTYTLGSSDYRWTDLWAEEIHVGTSTWAIRPHSSSYAYGTLEFRDETNNVSPLTLSQSKIIADVPIELIKSATIVSDLGHVPVLKVVNTSAHPSANLFEIQSRVEYEETLFSVDYIGRTTIKNLGKEKVLGFVLQNSEGDNVFTVSSDGLVLADTGYDTPAADYAEYFYTNNTNISSGEVVCIDFANNNAISRCATSSDSNIIGIISTKPGFIGNSKEEYKNNPNYKLVALLGQIPAFVSNENGDINPGDSLTSASRQGYLMKANQGDSTVGVALESFSGDFGTINVLISRNNKSVTVNEIEKEVTTKVLEAKDENISEIQSIIDSYNIEQRFDSLNNEITNLRNQLNNSVPSSEQIVENATIDQLDGIISLNKLTDIEAVNFVWIENETQINKLGFITTQVEEIAPELLNIDESGNKSIDYESFTPVMVSAIQEQQQQINEIRAQFGMSLDALEDLVLSGALQVEGLVDLGRDTVGQAKILTGATSTAVMFEHEYRNDPVITISPRALINGGYYIDEVTKNGFVIKIENTQETDVIFDWHSFGAYKGMIFSSDGTSELISSSTEQGLIEETPIEDTTETTTEDNISSGNQTTETSIDTTQTETTTEQETPIEDTTETTIEDDISSGNQTTETSIDTTQTDTTTEQETSAEETTETTITETEVTIETIEE
jgi:hypothetical protein